MKLHSYRCWPNYGDRNRYCRIVEAWKASDAAERFVEEYHSLLDHPTQIRIFVQEVSNEFGDPSCYRVLVRVEPTATAHPTPIPAEEDVP